MSQMTIIEREAIEGALRRGWTIPEIARDIHRPPQTVTNEIRKRRIDSDKGAVESNPSCRWFGECRRTHVCDTNCGMDKWCRNCHRCFLLCRDYEVRTCDRLVAPPFVCNGCRDERTCRLPKKFHIAKVAEADRQSRLHESRSHVHASDEAPARMDEALRNGLGRKQAIHHIMASNPDAFEGVTGRTVYNYVGTSCLSVGRGDLPYACMRKPKAKKAQTKTNAKCRVNRTYDLFVLWRNENPKAPVPEVDTLKGTVGGKVLFTINFPCQFMMGFIRERETAQTWRTKVLYCDPYCPTQKPHVERNHEELRRILLKGTSFNALEQEDINVVVSHVNGNTRPSINDLTPYDAFVRTYGHEGRRLLDRLGIVKIPANEVTLDPYVLGKRFKRHAERVILRKNGVTNRDGAEARQESRK